MKIKSLYLVDDTINKPPATSVTNNYKIVPGLAKLKKINTNYLVFSPLLHKLHLIPEETYNHLISGQKYLKNKEELIESGILIPSDYNVFPKNYDYSEIRGFSISLTAQCNLRCAYCFTRGGETSIRVNNFDYIKSIIDYIRTHNRENRFNVSLLSTGEPTLAFDLIKKIREYLDSLELNKVTIGIVTNGTFSREVAQWLNENIDRMMITMDGPPEIHDKQRPLKGGSESSKIIEKNIKFFVENKKKISVNSVITKHSVDKQTEILNYFHSLGVERLNFSPLAVYGRCLDGSSHFTTIDLNKYVENWLKARELAEEYSIKLTSNLLQTKKLRNRGCGFLGFLADGRISLCSGVNELSKNKELSKIFIIGHYDEKKNKMVINKNRQKILIDRTTERISECKKCPYKWSCGGGCALDSFINSGNLYAPDSRCKATKDIYSKFLTYKAEKHFVQIKPYLEESKNGLYFSMIFNKFKLKRVEGNKKINGSSLININSNQNLEELADRIIKIDRVKKHVHGNVLFLFSFKFEIEDLNSGTGKNIVNFLSKLKNQGIYFRVTKPLPRCLYPHTYKKNTELFNIPKSCFDCLELFKVNNGFLVLCNGEKYNLRDFSDREEIYKKFLENKKINKECKFCRYHIRNQCNVCLA